MIIHPKKEESINKNMFNHIFQKLKLSMLFDINICYSIIFNKYNILYFI